MSVKNNVEKMTTKMSVEKSVELCTSIYCQKKCQKQPPFLVVIPSSLCNVAIFSRTRLKIGPFSPNPVAQRKHAHKWISNLKCECRVHH